MLQMAGAERTGPDYMSQRYRRGVTERRISGYAGGTLASNNSPLYPQKLAPLRLTPTWLAGLVADLQSLDWEKRSFS